jgi:hypothetical protein
VTLSEQGCDEPRADITGRAGNQDPHATTVLATSPPQPIGEIRVNVDGHPVMDVGAESDP